MTNPQTEWSISDIARLTGTTSRTLRHYGDIGLLAATRTASNGYRYYNAPALTRLQRILLLRELGLGLPAIADVLAGQTNDDDALAAHLHWLREEKTRLDRQIRSVETTLSRMKGKQPLMAHDMFDGFDHTVYKDEVEQRWGRDAYAASDTWWRSKSESEKAEWMLRQKHLAADWAAAATSGVSAGSAEAQALARRQFEWLRGIPGTPGDGSGPTREYFVGLGEMYVTDDRFAANYGGVSGATFVRDAMRHFADLHLGHTSR